MPAKRKLSYAPRRSAKRSRRTVARYVPRPISQMKHRFTHLNEVTINTISPGTSWYDPLEIPLGTGVNDRVGTTLFVKSIDIAGIIANKTAANHVVRYVLLKTDIDANFTNTTEFLHNLNNSDGQMDIDDTSGLDSMYAPVDKQVAQPLLDKLAMLGVGGDGQHGFFQKFKHTVRFQGRGLRVKYRGLNTAGAVKYPRLHFGMWTAEVDDDVSVGEQVEFSAMVKVNYHEP